MRILAISLLLPALGSFAATAAEPSREELQRRIQQLQSEVEKLSAVVEGTAQPINLARTDFAAVLAASVNSGAPANKFYGVLNAFDGGENFHNGINYTYWLSSGGAGQFIEVRFDHPVTVSGVVIEGGPRCTPVFTFGKGGEKPSKAFAGQFQPEAPLHGVTRVRLAFDESTSNIRVNEIRVMGHPHPDVKYKITRPRLMLDERGAIGVAQGEFQRAGFPMNHVEHRVIEHMDRWEIIFHHGEDDVDLFRVVVFKKQSRVATKKLAKWAPIEE